MFHRLQEDVLPSGLPLETRMYDERGKRTVRIKVLKHRTIEGVPVVVALESVADTPAGEVLSRTTCENLQVECSK